VTVEPAEVDRRVERLKALSRAAGLKLTHQRLEVFREVAASLEHPDADTLFRAVRRRVPTVSLDTVYRTLWRLNDLGLIRTLGPRRESVRFDANLAPHHHYVCVRCGLARDFESAELNALRVPEAVKRLGTVAGTHVEVRGVCEGCRKRGQRPSQPASRGGKGAGDSTSPNRPRRQASDSPIAQAAKGVRRERQEVRRNVPVPSPRRRRHVEP
jgi:Fur family peroxide stress response transcriptional regulator